MVAGVGSMGQEPLHLGVLLYSLGRYSRFVAIIVSLSLQILMLLLSMWYSGFDTFVQQRTRGL